MLGLLTFLKNMLKNPFLAIFLTIFFVIFLKTLENFFKKFWTFLYIFANFYKIFLNIFLKSVPPPEKISWLRPWHAASLFKKHVLMILFKWIAVRGRLVKNVNNEFSTFKHFSPMRNIEK